MAAGKQIRDEAAYQALIKTHLKTKQFGSPFDPLVSKLVKSPKTPARTREAAARLLNISITSRARMVESDNLRTVKALSMQVIAANSEKLKEVPDYKKLRFKSLNNGEMDWKFRKAGFGSHRGSMAILVSPESVDGKYILGLADGAAVKAEKGKITEILEAAGLK